MRCVKPAIIKNFSQRTVFVSSLTFTIQTQAAQVAGRVPAPPGCHATAFRRLIALILHLCTAKWAPRHPVPGQETGVKVRQPTEDDVITKSRLEPEHRSCLVPDLEFATSTPRGPAAHGPGRGRQRRARRPASSEDRLKPLRSPAARLPPSARPRPV